MNCPRCSEVMRRHYALPAWRCANADCTEYDRWAVERQPAARLIAESMNPSMLPPAPNEGSEQRDSR